MTNASPLEVCSEVHSGLADPDTSDNRVYHVLIRQAGGLRNAARHSGKGMAVTATS
jgi:hypothetical protein